MKIERSVHNNPIFKHLITRLGYSYDEAQEELLAMHEEVLNGGNPDEILYNIGLEPDYIFDLLSPYT